MKLSKVCNCLLVIVLMVIVMLQSCHSTDKTEANYIDVNGSKVPDSATMEDKVQVAMFIEQAALGSMLEISLGKLASEKLDNPRIKDYGRLMVQEHERIIAALKILSVVKDVKFPVSLPENEQERVLEMSKMENKYFDQLYMKMVFQNNRKYIELFRSGYDSPDVLIRDFAHKFLPVLEKQLIKADSVLIPVK